MKNFKAVIGFLLISVLCIFMFKKLIYYKSVVICGKFDRISDMRGSTIYIYKYVYNGEKIEGIVYPNDLKIKDFNQLQQIECVKIECSTFFPSMARCIDKNILR